MFFKGIKIFFSVVVFFFMSSVYADKDSTNQNVEQLKSFVDSGLDYINKYGKNKAYAEFSNPKGKFRQGNLYLFVYNNEGTCLADGNNENRLGKNFLNQTDTYGTPIIKLMIEIVKQQAGGFLSYYWSEPLTEQIKLKTSYVKAIDKDVFIGAGVYKSLVVSKNIKVKIEELKAYINFAIDYYQKHGQEAAFKEYDKTDGLFTTDGDMYLGVLNFQGVQLAYPGGFGIGKRWDHMVDEFGTPYVKLFFETAKAGGGIVSYYNREPSTGKIKLKFTYTKLIPNTNLIICAGVYDD